MWLSLFVYYQSSNPLVLSVDLNLGRKNWAVCALVGKNDTVYKVRFNQT